MTADFLTICRFTEDEARTYLERVRWGEDGAVCPFCDCETTYKLTTKKGSSTRKGCQAPKISTTHK